MPASMRRPRLRYESDGVRRENELHEHPTAERRQTLDKLGMRERVETR
jgi:hypothetical protein